MSFVQNGGFEAAASKLSSNTTNTSNTNPFGLKDFARMLDNKFGNSAFSDNLLAAPPKQKQNINPFDTAGKWERPNINDYYNKNNPYSIKPKQAAKAENTNKESIFSQEGSSSPTSVFEGMQINKGTGMSQGGCGRHKLDFCY